MLPRFIRRLPPSSAHLPLPLQNLGPHTPLPLHPGAFTQHPHCCLRRWSRRKMKASCLTLSSMCKSASQAVLRRMQLNRRAAPRTPHVSLRARCKQCLPGRSNTRRAPCRHCRHARVHGCTNYGHRTISSTPPPRPRPRRRKGIRLSKRTRYQYAMYENVMSAQALEPSVSITRSRNGAPSRKGCVLNGHMTNASSKWVPDTPRAPPPFFVLL